MLRRLLIAVVLVTGLLTVATAGRPAAGHAATVPRLAARSVTSGWLYGVSATSATNVWAVGAFPHADGYASLVEHGNGRTWKQLASPLNLPENDDSLFGVAAVSPTTAWAAGEESNQYAFPLIYSWNGHAWTRDATPTPGGDGGSAYLTGVAAESATDAWAVGGYLPDLGTDTLILHWTGHAWVQVPSPSPAGSASTAISRLQGVAVLSPTDAWAVGEANSIQPSVPWITVIEHWNGSAWATVTSPDPSVTGCVNDRLLGVAARPAATWAVGSYCGAPLALRLAGGHWKQVATPKPPAGRSEQLAAVAVTSAANAWAVGNSGDRALILHWNGKTWATVAAPSPAGAQSVTLAGVTAVSASAAWAVGEADFAHGVRKPLMERWTGSKWKLVPIPNPTS
jgi:hypothetical protein